MDLDEKRFKVTPKLELDAIKDGFDGATQLKEWEEYARIEFSKTYGTVCKPYHINEVRWLWKGSVKSVISNNEMTYNFIKTPEDFNNLASKNGGVALNYEAHYEMNVKLKDLRIAKVFDAESRKMEYFFYKKEAGKTEAETKVSDEDQIEILHALLTWFARNAQTASALMGEKGKCKTLEEFFGGTHQSLMRECLSRGIQFMTQKLEKNLLLYFLKGTSYKHLDHFLESIRKQKNVSKKLGFWALDRNI